MGAGGFGLRLGRPIAASSTDATLDSNEPRHRCRVVPVYGLGFPSRPLGDRLWSTGISGGPMNQLTEILAEKGDVVLRVDADSSVLEAVRRMVDSNVGSLLVTDHGRDIGIVTERDYLRRVTLEGRDESETSVREIISSPLVVVTPQT